MKIISAQQKIFLTGKINKSIYVISGTHYIILKTFQKKLQVRIQGKIYDIVNISLAVLDRGCLSTASSSTQRLLFSMKS